MSALHKALMEEAAVAEASKQYSRAEALYAQVLDADAANANALLHRAIAIAYQGRVEEAVEAFVKALGADPNSLLALTWLARLLRDCGKLQPALAYAERAARLAPNDAGTMYNIGLCYFALDRFEEAMFCLERCTALEPSFGAGYYAMGRLYEAIGQPWQALMAIEKNVKIDPQPPGFLKLAQLYLAVGKLPDAIEWGEKALDGGATAEVHLLLADAYTDSDPDRSRSHLDAASALDPRSEHTFANARAKRLSRLGRIEEAEAIYARLAGEKGDSGASFLNLVTVKKVRVADRELLSQMLAVLDGPELPARERVYLHFALGKAFDDLGEYEDAMRHYDLANETNLQVFPWLTQFSSERFAQRVDALMGLFTREFIAQNAFEGNPSSRPIFVLGMMRSGTTLAEQILSSHSKIAAGGELAHWSYSERKIVNFARRQVHRENIAEAVDVYERILRAIDPSSEFVTDKNPGNVFALGLIAMAYPRAQIVHMVRDPVDTALSIYMTPTRHPPEFGGKRESIVQAMRQYTRLAEHWRTVLPPERLYRVSFEDLVRSPEQITREMIAACGLEWEDACAHPEQNSAMVGTPSMWQVRQPVSAGAIGRSERYGKWLGEFSQLAKEEA